MEGVIFMRIKPFLFCITALFIMIVILFVDEALAVQYKITFVRKISSEAVLKIDGKRYRLERGEKTPHGIKLVSATKDEAVIMINDIKYRYKKGSSQGTALIARLLPKRGHWTSKGTINKKPTKFLIDTGATTVLLGEKHARSLKISYKFAKRIKVRILLCLIPSVCVMSF
jgi:aspartyl protease family protein